MKNGKKKYVLFTVIFFFAVTAFAQVTIGSGEIPEKAALLDIKTKKYAENTEPVSSDRGGLLLPRVKISDIKDLGVFSEVTGLNDSAEKLKHTGLTVYNIGTTDNNGKVLVEEGIYVWDGEKWMKAGISKPNKFFYMPSIEIPITTPISINLYNEYVSQFTSPKAASTGAPASIPCYKSNELYYYITNAGKDSDGNEIFTSFNITVDGELTYTVNSNLPDDVCCSYINIVFVVK